MCGELDEILITIFLYVLAVQPEIDSSTLTVKPVGEPVYKLVDALESYSSG